MRNQLSIVCRVLVMGFFCGALVSCADDAPKPKLPSAFPVKAATNAETVSAPTAAATTAISSANSNAIAATKPAAIPSVDPLTSSATSNPSLIELPSITLPKPAAIPSVDPLTSSATSNPSLIELPSITLPKPAAWMWVKPSMQFRTLQYQVCAQASGKGAPCADLIVSVFKLGDGGSVDANIERWKNQFQNTDGSPAQPTRSQRVVAGVSVTRVDVKGAWKGMGMSQAQNNSEQLAAVIELPKETIYIRVVGPESIVEGARKDFEAMVDGLAPRTPLAK